MKVFLYILLLGVSLHTVYAGKIFDSDYYMNQKNHALTEKYTKETNTEQAKLVLYYSLAGGVMLISIANVIKLLRNGKK